MAGLSSLLTAAAAADYEEIMRNYFTTPHCVAFRCNFQSKSNEGSDVYTAFCLARGERRGKMRVDEHNFLKTCGCSPHFTPD